MNNLIESFEAAFEAAFPLHHAAREGNIPQMTALIASGSDIDAEDEDGYTPLMMALYNRHQEAALTLIQQGAGIDYCDLTAAIGFVDELVPLLIQRGAEINPPRRRLVTPLMAAASNESSDILRLLLEKGAEVNTRDVYNRTPSSSQQTMAVPRMLVFLLRMGLKLMPVIAVATRLYRLPCEMRNRV